MNIPDVTDVEARGSAAVAVGDMLLTTKQVLSVVNMSRTWLEAALRDGSFPKPLPVSAGKGEFKKGGVRLWSAKTVAKWIEDLQAKNSGV
jgi:predicted DNA-binding transcriptional regulator AlpA